MTTRRALLFDLDGTMLDTDALHINAYNTLLEPQGKSIDLDYYRRFIMGFGVDDIMSGLLPECDRAAHLQFSEEKERLFRAQLTELTPTAGLEDLLDWAEAMRWGTAVVTNAPRDNADRMLAGLGLSDRFDVVVIACELEHEKPHPYPYRLAAERAGSDSSLATAFEDSLAGVTSASSSGAYTFGMLTALSEGELRKAGASAVLTDFTQDSLWDHLERTGGAPRRPRLAAGR
jgi:HAD superfamily hydrolase (TIGR01509 family)